MLANPSSICTVCEVGMFFIIDPISVGGNLKESFYVVALGADGLEEQGQIKEKKTRIEIKNNEQRKGNLYSMYCVIRLQ